MKTKFCSLSSLLLALTLGGCAGSNSDSVVRLVDHFDPATVEGSPSTAQAGFEPTWNFASANSAEMHGWQAGPGVADLRIEGGQLKGRTTTDSPVIYRRGMPGPEGEDLYSIAVKISLSQEADASVRTAGPQANIEQVVEGLAGAPWPMTRRVQASSDSQDVEMLWTNEGSGNQTLLIRPAALAGVEFQIASVDLVSQRKHRASTPTSVEWQGLGNIFRETIASRSPESFTYQLDVPANSWLDLHVGTIEQGAVTFVVEDVSAEPARPLLRRTVTTPNRWDAAPIDLEPGPATLRFTVEGDKDLLAGYWGSPAVRVRGAKPQPQKAPAFGAVEPPLGVVIFLVDTLRRDHLGSYGYERETDPNLARMAANGVTFLDNVSQAAWTKVSTPSILTSLYPISHRVHQQSDRLSAAAETLAEVYRSAGYATVSYPTNNFAGRATNLHQGFEEVHEATSFPAALGSKTAREATDRALDWIERHADGPFFVYMHVTDPHSPFEPRPPYDSTWADPSAKEEHERQRDASRKFIDWAPNRGMPDRHEAVQAGIDPDEWIKLEKDWYDGSIRGSDAELGRILERLESMGLRDKVAVALIADHGEEFYEHGSMWHGQHPYGELANVPLVLSYPPLVPQGLKIEETTRSIDLMPTLLDLSGLEAPAGVQGQSLTPLIAAAENIGSGSGSELVTAAQNLGWMPLAAVTEKAATKGEGPEPRLRESYGLVKDGWKLVHNIDNAGDSPEFELFNHRDDPLDLNNVAAANQSIVEGLTTELEAWRNMVEQGQLPRGDAEEQLPPEELDRLRSLGYIQ